MYAGRRLLFTGTDQVTVEKVDFPEPEENQILVRVSRSQLSAGTEYRMFRRMEHIAGPKRNLGYTTVGQVEAIGSGVEGFQPGDRVLSTGVHGSYWTVTLTGTPSDTINIAKIDWDITDESAAFSVLGGVALHGVRRAKLSIDESVAVFGVGVLGQLTLQFCRLSGAYPIIAVDLDRKRLEIAREVGATHTIQAGRDDPVEEIGRITNGHGVETTFNVAGPADILPDVLRCTADRGKMVLIASPSGTVEIGLQDDILRREIDIIGTYTASLHLPHPYWPWSLARNRQACWRLIQSGDLNVAILISHIVQPEEAQNIYDMIAAGPSGWMSVFFSWD